jgi:hypothetical protein
MAVNICMSLGPLSSPGAARKVKATNPNQATAATGLNCQEGDSSSTTFGVLADRTEEKALDEVDRTWRGEYLWGHFSDDFSNVGDGRAACLTGLFVESCGLKLSQS